jgi:dTDP-4-dehydrorhamnose 3,5-epimerase
MGKLVRTLTGHMVDMVVDIRKNSPTFGHGIMYSMPSNCHEWIWVPPGFAHGNYFTESTTIEYFCTGDYNPKCEAGLCPLSEDIDWSLADSELVYMFKRGDWILSEKDRNGFSLERWKSDERSEVFKVGAAS